MSLFSLQVTSANIVALQQGILFTTTNAADINNQVSSINAPGTTETVASYANQLLASVQATSQMAMGVSALETGANQTVAVLTNLVTNPGVIPAYLNFAASKGLDAGQVVGESLGLAFSGAPGFATLAGMSTGAFAAAVSGTFGINQSFLVTQVQFFINLYTGISPFPGNPNPTAAQIQAAANGVVFGLAVALNIEGVSTPTSIATTTQTQVKNALFDIAQTGQSPPGQMYVPGLTLPTHPVPTPFQGGPNITGVFLTQGNDTPTTGFATDANGTPKVPPGFTASVANTVITAVPFVTANGLGNNTLNTGDNIQTTGAAVGATTLVETTSASAVAANPAFAQNVTINGVNEVDITGQNATLNGFTGTVNGVTTVKNINSNGTVQLGGINQGLNGALANVTITGYGGGNGTFIMDVVVNPAAAGLPTTINAELGGAALGTTKLVNADILGFTAQGNPGTLASPNTAYPTWNLKIDNPANLMLTANTAFPAGTLFTSNVVGTTAIVLTGTSTALSTDFAGNFALLKSVDGSADTGNVFITGASSSTDSAGGYFSTALSSSTNPFWAFGGVNGLLEGNTVFNNFKGGAGVNLLDVTSLNPGQVAGLTASGNTTNQNQLVVTNAAATTTVTTTFAGITNFQQLDVTGIGGTINLANMPAAMALNDIFYITPATANVTILNQSNLTAPLTVDTEDNASATFQLGFGPPGKTQLALPAFATTNLTVGKLGALPATGQTLTVVIGDPLHNTPAFLAGVAGVFPVAGTGPAGPGYSAGAGFLGNVTTFGDNTVTIMAQGQTQGGPIIWDFVKSVDVTPLVAANPSVTLSGNTNLFAEGVFSLDPGTQFIQQTGLTLTITDSALVVLGDTEQFFAPGKDLSALSFSTNAQVLNASTSGGLIMEGGDVGFTFGPTVATSVGDIITGSTTKGNVLNGSIGNDTFTGNTAGTASDTIVTSGGADKITVAAGHSAPDVFDFYSGELNAAPFFGFGPGLDVPAHIGSVVFGALNGAPLGTADTPELGWWAQPTGGTPLGYSVVNGGVGYAGFAQNTGTVVGNEDLAHINGFVAGGGTPANPSVDAVSFSVTSFGGVGGLNFFGGTTFGLTEGGHWTAPLAGTFAGATPFPAGVVQGVAQGGPAPTTGNTVAGNTELIELTTGQFADANAVVTQLDQATSTFFITAGAAVGAGASFHLLVAYATPNSATNIMDLAVFNPAPVTAPNANTPLPVSGMILHGSDIVQITGIAPTDLHGGNFHLVA